MFQLFLCITATLQFSVAHSRIIIVHDSLFWIDDEDADATFFFFFFSDGESDRGAGLFTLGL